MSWLDHLTHLSIPDMFPGRQNPTLPAIQRPAEARPMFAHGQQSPRTVEAGPQADRGARGGLAVQIGRQAPAAPVQQQRQQQLAQIQRALAAATAATV